jgi:hypothetical protein
MVQIDINLNNFGKRKKEKSRERERKVTAQPGSSHLLWLLMCVYFYF